MKKNLLLLIPALALVFFVTSCSKSDTTPPANNTAEGKWTGGYNNNIGGPVNYLAVIFSAGNAVRIEANSPTVPDIANGTWSIVGDSIIAHYTYAATATSFSLAGKYNSSSNLINGTIGIGSNTSGSYVFSVTKN